MKELQQLTRENKQVCSSLTAVPYMCFMIISAKAIVSLTWLVAVCVNTIESVNVTVRMITTTLVTVIKISSSFIVPACGEDVVCPHVERPTADETSTATDQREGPSSEGEESSSEREPAAPAVPATGSATQNTV